MDSTIPADLLKLKARLDAWRAARKHARQPIPDEFRQAAVEMAKRYSPSLVRHTLKLDPWRLQKLANKKPGPARHKLQTAFFTLPPEAATLLSTPPVPQDAAGCRLQLERPDGARLTLTLPSLDFMSINRLCTDFLRP